MCLGVGGWVPTSIGAVRVSRPRPEDFAVTQSPRVNLRVQGVRSERSGAVLVAFLIDSGRLGGEYRVRGVRPERF